jgi:hypothetical protein
MLQLPDLLYPLKVPEEVLAMQEVLVLKVLRP